MTTTAPEGTTAATSLPPVFRFGGGSADGDASMRNLLGGKGAGLAEMCSLGIPVPPGFTITTEVLQRLLRPSAATTPTASRMAVREAVEEVGRSVGAGFGDTDNPLLVSVRSGARVSMPGMMDTVLNLGLNDETAEGLARRSGSPRFAYDSYRRFVQMYGDVVLGVRAESDTDEDPFEALLERKKHARGVELDTGLDAAALRELVAEFKSVICLADWPRLPRRPVGAALGRDRRGLQLLGEPARRRLPRALRLPLGLGDGGQRAGDGLRQPRRGLRGPASSSRATPPPASGGSAAST